MSKFWADPPSGWRYGFPKVMEVKRGEPFDINKWLIDNGYPEHLIKSFNGALPVRWWPYREGEDKYDPLSADDVEIIPRSMFKMEE